MAENYIQEYTRRFTSYAGCDMHAVFNGRPIAELQQITIGVRREKGPIYTCGSPNPRCFARGKRGIAGTLVFTSFNRDALLEEMARVVPGLPSMPRLPVYRAETDLLIAQYRGIEDWNSLMQRDMALNEQGLLTEEAFESMTSFIDPEDFEYADQLFPFNITISFKNEYGSRSRLDILGVEILNDSWSGGIDDLAMERVYTYVALAIKPFRKTSGLVAPGRASKEDVRSAGTAPSLSLYV